MFPLRDLNPTRLTPVVTIALIAANLAVFFLWQPTGDPAAEFSFVYERAAVPCELTSGEPLSITEIRTGRCIAEPSGPQAFPEKVLPLSILVSMFLHGGLLHVLGNMWFLWIFGNNVEEAYGRFGYAALYVLGGVAATLAFVALRPASTVPLVGASGAIAAVLGSYFVLFPNHWILSLLFIYVLPVPAVLFLGVWFLGQFAVTDPGVAWEAHAAGFVFGVAVTLVLRGPLLGRVRRLHARRTVPW